MDEGLFKLHVEFANWIDKESVRISGLVQDLTHRAPAGNVLPKDDNLPVAAHIGPDDIIGTPRVYHSDIAGTLVTRFYPRGGRWLGLADEGMLQARKVAERIWNRPELRDRLSRQTIDDLLLEWVGATVNGQSPSPLSADIERTVTEKVKQLSVVIPIDEIYIDEEFSFATATVIPLSRVTLDHIVHIGASNMPAEQAQMLREDLHRRWLGKAGMRFELTAESSRAQEIAFERATDYMTLLQFYGAPAMILSLISHAAPTGARPYRTVDCLSYAPETIQRAKSVAEPTYQLNLTAALRAEAERSGLTTLSSLAQTPACDYEEKLVETLLVYGRACYQLDPTDKLLQVMTAVEMFALRNANEPIQATLADRLAFAINDNPNIRQEIAANLRAAYGLRSGRSHHGKSISDTKTIEQFLGNAWAFFLTAIHGVGRYRTPAEFLDNLDRLKYGHSP
jgi:hypothetical protein